MDHFIGAGGLPASIFHRVDGLAEFCAVAAGIYVASGNGAGHDIRPLYQNGNNARIIPTTQVPPSRDTPNFLADHCGCLRFPKTSVIFLLKKATI